MDCRTLRERLEADPAQLDLESTRHLEECAACVAYSERVSSAEALIHEALRFDVAALKQQAANETVVAAGTVVYSRRIWFAVAATMVVGVSIWLGASHNPTVDYSELVAEVEGHWFDEPQSWVRSDVQVTPAMLATAVGEHAEIDVGGLGLVSYAMSCFVRGEWVPHLVMQGERGPVMLLLLPHERVDEPVPLSLPEEGLSGVIVPLGEGSVAVMGEADESMEPIRERLGAAVEWSI